MLQIKYWGNRKESTQHILRQSGDVKITSDETGRNTIKYHVKLTMKGNKMVYINNTRIIKLILEDCPINYADIVIQITLLTGNCKQTARLTLSTAKEYELDCHWWINVNNNTIVLNIGWTNQSVIKIEL